MKPQGRAWNLEQGVGGKMSGNSPGSEMGLIQAERTSRAQEKMHKMAPPMQRMVRDWVGWEPGIPGGGGKK